MKVFSYAESKSLDKKPIPRTADGNLVLYSDILYTSRTIKNLNYKPDISDYEGVDNEQLEPYLSYWSDYKYDGLKYILEYQTDEFIDNINNQINVFDKILNLNPKQIGTVNSNIPKLFCEGNEIHYTILTNGFVPMINSRITDASPNDADFARNIKYNEGIMGWGDIKVNHILFASILDTFYSIDTEYADVESIGAIAALRARLSQDDINKLAYINFKTQDGNYIPYFIYTTGSKIGEIFSYIDDPIHKEYSIRLSKDVHFSSEGNLKGALNKSTGMRPIELQLKKMYFWKSAIITTISEDNVFSYYFVVGMIPKNYSLNNGIDKIFFVDLGNTFENDKFDNTDIILYYSTLKNFLKKCKAKTIYFTNLSNHPMGNVCKNGLVFGADSELVKTIVKNINTGSANYCSTEYEIINIYNIFTNLEG